MRTSSEIRVAESPADPGSGRVLRVGRADPPRTPTDRSSARGLSLSGVRKTFRSRREEAVAIADLTLEVRPGELVVLLGPSGCGKTTTLRCAAGLEQPDVGHIDLDGNTVFDAERQVYQPPEKRNIGMVFQNYALWPHMTVRRNIEYPLRVRRNTPGLRDGWADAIAEVVECGALLDRYPSELSGGQQQRVALARGLVARPAMMLFDEPLSNLDARLRAELRTEIHRLHEELGFSGLYVTHDQEEAMVVGDRIILMREGAIEQDDVPEAVFRRPATSWAAAFLGVTNQLPIEPGPAGWRSEGRVALEGLPTEGLDRAREVRVRPEEVQVGEPGRISDGRCGFAECRVEASIFSGLFTEHLVRVGDVTWSARGDGSGHHALEVGAPCSISFPRSSTLLYGAGGEAVGQSHPMYAGAR